MTLGKKIRTIRQHKRMTMKEVAMKLAVSPSTYRDWEYGSKVPADALPKLAKVLEVSIDELMEQASSKQEIIKKAIVYLEESIRLLRTL